MTDKSKQNPENIIVCRCEDISLADIENAIEQGITSLEQLKRFLHVGMGPCQGRTCGRIIARLMAEKTGRPLSQFKRTKPRPPLTSIPIHSALKEKNE